MLIILEEAHSAVQLPDTVKKRVGTNLCSLAERLNSLKKRSKRVLNRLEVTFNAYGCNPYSPLSPQSLLSE